VKVVLRKRADAPPFRFRSVQAAAVFFLGFATHALILGDLSGFVAFGVVAALAAAWGAGWRVFVRQEPPKYVIAPPAPRQSRSSRQAVPDRCRTGTGKEPICRLVRILHGPSSEMPLWSHLRGSRSDRANVGWGNRRGNGPSTRLTTKSPPETLVSQALVTLP
jgi:hypothetical protein